MKQSKKKREVYYYGNVNSIAAGVVHEVLLMRRRYNLFFPILSAFSGCLLLVFVAFALLSSPPPIVHHHHHHQHIHRRGYDSLYGDGAPVESASFQIPGSGGSSGRDLWRTRLSNLYCGCSNASSTFQTANLKTHPNRYLLIATSGGLNQQRTGITDAVVAAYILNATLVVPKLDEKSFWKDTSDFAEIFDVDWFIKFLARDVQIIKHLPAKDGKVITPYHMRVPRKCNPKCYQTRVLPALNKKHAVQLGKFDYRLSNKLDVDLQKLRCRVNYHALRFTDPILEMGKKLVERMRLKSEHFITLHLRFEPDMLAFSGCDFGGGEKEREELGAIRKRWKTLRASNPEKVRRHGRCPLTPEEVGFMLRALGFGSDVHIYVASGEVYGGERTLAPLKALFPNFHSKDTLASKEELAPFLSFSSRMAALDFIVCDESDVFVTNNNGNMARILAGRRRYFGHKPTIRPNAKKLYKVFMNRQNMTWQEFASRVRTSQIGFMGEPKEVKPGVGEFHENPASCICEKSEAKPGIDLVPPSQKQNGQNYPKDNYKNSETADAAEEHITEEDPDQDLFYTDYLENNVGLKGKEVPNERYIENGVSQTTELPELDEFFSD